MSTCPCCGQTTTPVKAPFYVRLDNNCLVVDGAGSFRVTPQAAEIAAVLVERHPAQRPIEDIATRVYGGNKLRWPREWHQSLRTRLAALRKVLRPAGLAVEWTPGRGYRVGRL